MGAAVALCFLLREGPTGREVLLGRKKRGFGRGKVVGLGGHVEPGESAACVELDAAHVVPAGTVDFRFPARPDWDMECTMFTCTRWSGEVCETEEIEPRWYPVDALPVAHMWQDADHWLPIVLAGAAGSPPDFLVVMAEDNETVARFQLIDKG